MLDYLQQLNPEQREAVQTTEGPLLVLAGAGTGKTKTLTTRIAHLINSGVPAHQILAVTFTNKAAHEMVERVRKSLGDDVIVQPTVKTFHSLGVMILRTWHEKMNLKKYFTILDTDDQVSMLRIIMEREGISTKEWDPRELVRAMSYMRLHSNGNLETLETRSARDDIVQQVWRHYQSTKARDGVVDFDDLIEIPVKLLQQHADVRDYYHRLWQYVHVDEYQDTSDLQYEMIRLLLGSHMNLCVVGDGDQTIYTWRGATMRNIMQFTNDFPGAHMVALTKNYRSTQTILDAANAVIANNIHRIPKDLSTDVGWGKKIVQYHAYDEADEAGWVADKICSLQESDDVDLSQVAILYRSHYQSRALEEAMINRHIPYSITGVKFFDRKEIKDVMAYLRAAVAPGNLVDLKRVCETPKRGIGKAAWAHICAHQTEALSGKAAQSWNQILGLLAEIRNAAEKHSPSEVMRFVLEKSGVQAELIAEGTAESMERVGNIRELVTFAARYDAIPGSPREQTENMLESVALLSESDATARTEGDERIHMLTIHAAKGLEFDVVFMVGLEEGVFPSDMGDKADRDAEEERRLMYVALTRARKHLHISYAMTRRIYGRVGFQSPSQFLAEIPNHLVESVGDTVTPGQPVGTISLLDW